MLKRKASLPRSKPLARLHTRALMVRLTEKQYLAFDQQAAAQGLATSTWARMILLREVKGENQEGK